MSSSNWFIVSHHYKCWLGKHRAPMFQVILINLYRVPSIDASYQISVHLRKWFQRRRFLEINPFKNKNGLWWPCLLTDRGEMSNLYRGPSIDASYQVSVHLAKRFQRRIFFKSANQKQELPMVVMFVNGSGQNEQSLQRTFHRCFLPNFSSFGRVVSKRKIKMWKVNGRQKAMWAKNNLWCSIKNCRLRGLHAKGYLYWKNDKILKTKLVQYK